MKLVTIGNYREPSEAYIIKGQLEAVGIKCHVADEKLIGNIGLYVAYGGIKLQVREEDVEKAREIIEG